MKKTTSLFIKVLFVFSLIFPLMGQNSHGECIKVGTDLGMDLSCVTFSGNFFSLSFDFFNNPDDPTGVFWKLDDSKIQNAVSEPGCVVVNPDLSVLITCSELSGTHYDFTLVSSDLANFLWRVDNATVGVKSGSSLFTQRCGGCHTGNGMGSGSVGDRTGRTAQQIQNAIQNVSSMNQAVGDLTFPEIQAIADALKP